ncbi:hypothetical protein KQX63_24285 [Rhodopseudomonas palustris]|jgi:hypothetical protein|uniref:Signal recognition particle-docking protein FtsY n=1 Tax=Rhodopseudomonas palustris TaxID=1076 RepID=A0AAX3DZ11_RHOPL|nr:MULTISPECIES: hypothetical protein [Rhodopseudomonas]NEV75798.1 hypothetical protein [Rhodopseudomonas sp. BR0C11]UYO39697.1 hypothetical protein KQX62_23895 [Rhodopseudomonas palustris]UYO44425.1 hypothetical protein KQX63_24285 [Rhodopseudomonas palustris]UYO53805.1 hypothetical protein KQX61_25110 [Rhodopseudomonas palustris]
MIGFLRKRSKAAAPKRDKKSGNSEGKGEAKPTPPNPAPAPDDDLYETGDICAPSRDRDDYTKDL